MFCTIQDNPTYKAKSNLFWVTEDIVRPRLACLSHKSKLLMMSQNILYAFAHIRLGGKW